MSSVKNIEAAVGEDHFASLAPESFADAFDLCKVFDLALDLSFVECVFILFDFVEGGGG